MSASAPIEPGHFFIAGDTLTAALLNKAFELARAVIPTPFSTSNGGTGAISVVAAQKNLSVVGYLQAWVEFSDKGTPVTIGTIPVDCFSLYQKNHGTEVFNGTGTDLPPDERIA